MARWLCETLREQGVLQRKPQPSWHMAERGTYYAVSETGTRFINARMLKRIDRAKVNRIIGDTNIIRTKMSAIRAREEAG